MKFKNRSNTLSIIIPTKNEEVHLPNLLESLLKQTFNDFEVIVADADSTDRTVEIAEYYGAKVVQGGRQAFGRNNGFRNSNGKYLLFNDADVVYKKANLLEKSLNYFQKSKYHVANYKYQIPIKESLKASIIYLTWNIMQGVSVKAKRPLGSGACLITYRDVFNNIGGFDEKVIRLEDYDFAKKIQRSKMNYGLLPYKIYIDPRAFQSFKSFYKTTWRYLKGYGVHKAGKSYDEKHKIEPRDTY